MPLIAGKTTIGASATQATTDATIGNYVATCFIITAPANATKFSNSTIATNTGLALAGNATAIIPCGPIGFALKEAWFSGTQNDVVQWLAVTT